jgi:CheY-like chemotaxis protein
MILVIDDEEVVRNAVVDVLEFSGFRVLSAASGVEGLQCFADHVGEVGVVLLDMKLPDMSGMETLRRLRTLNPAVGVILCSGLEESTLQREQQHDPTLAVLQKPYSLEALLDKIRQVTPPPQPSPFP